MKKDCAVNNQFSMGQPVTRSDYDQPIWIGTVMAIYQRPSGVWYVVRRDWEKIRHYMEDELQAVKQKPGLRIISGGKRA